MDFKDKEKGAIGSNVKSRHHWSNLRSSLAEQLGVIVTAESIKNNSVCCKLLRLAK
jgi:hypothetical protein